MIFLKNDYSLGSHPAVLQALVDTNMELHDGYGEDEYCRKAADRIRKMINCPDADVQFISGGTLTNLTALAAYLQRPHWSVISADSGHICVHESGAIEATGHKVNHVKTPDGKLRPEDIEDVLVFHEDEHYVLPKAIYISDSTETGQVYTKAELMALRACCNKHGLYIYLDGARLPMAFSSAKNDVEFTDLPQICDAFYFGGTKCGAMFGEALVTVNDDLKEDMRFLVKQRGGLMAKGRLMGVQFNALFDGGRYLDLGEHADRMAARLAEGIKEKGYEFYLPQESNMVFAMFPKEQAEYLATKVMFETYPVVTETHQCIRLVTSWGTTQEEVDAFLELI